MNTKGSKFDMAMNPAYQIEWVQKATGKLFSSTKRRVNFRFGFSNAAAIADGQHGVNCRGEEHEVVLVWSITSGKRLVIYDNKEIHFSTSKKVEGRFEISWTIGGGHIVKIVAHASLPFSAAPEFRQFDLLLDGCSFFNLPHIFELGISKMKQLDSSAKNHSSQEPHLQATKMTNPSFAFDDHNSVRSGSELTLTSIDTSTLGSNSGNINTCAADERSITMSVDSGNYRKIECKSTNTSFSVSHPAFIQNDFLC